MNVEEVSTNGKPMASNGGKEVANAFILKYRIDAKKAETLSGVYLETEKI